MPWALTTQAFSLKTIFKNLVKLALMGHKLRLPQCLRLFLRNLKVADTRNLRVVISSVNKLINLLCSR